MKKAFLIMLMLCLVVSMAACGSKTTKKPADTTNNTTNSTTTNNNSVWNPSNTTKRFTTIDMEEFAQMLKSSYGYVIIDVREEEDYNAGHIPGAINIPYRTIRREPISELTNLTQTIFVYGERNQSRIVCHNLNSLGYSDVYSCGDICDWKGEIVTSDVENSPAFLPVE